MARKQGSSAARVLQIRQWVSDQLDDAPMMPNAALVQATMAQFELGKSRASELVAAARYDRRKRQTLPESWQETQDAHVAALQDMLEEFLQIAYAAKLEGNYRQQISALREVSKLRSEILTYSPTRNFEQQSDHRAALRAAREAHLQDRPLWD